MALKRKIIVVKFFVSDNDIPGCSFLTSFPNGLPYGSGLVLFYKSVAYKFAGNGATIYFPGGCFLCHRFIFKMNEYCFGGAHRQYRKERGC